ATPGPRFGLPRQQPPAHPPNRPNPLPSSRWDDALWSSRGRRNFRFFREWFPAHSGLGEVEGTKEGSPGEASPLSPGEGPVTAWAGGSPARRRGTSGGQEESTRVGRAAWS